MQTTVSDLSELKKWCSEAKPGDEARFVVGQEITQEEASNFAFQVNSELDDHVWVSVEEKQSWDYVEGIGSFPKTTTHLHLRKTN